MPDYIVTFRVRVKRVSPNGTLRTQEEALKLAGQEVSLSLRAIKSGLDYEGDPTVETVPTERELIRARIREARQCRSALE